MPKRMLQGVVVSDKQDKTVVVRVERRFTHPVMKKTIRRSKTFHAHDENNEYKKGDVVQIEEHKPISKLKHWLVISGEKRAITEAPIESDSEKKPKSRSKAKAQ
jgi:small subunit ribosomal protein S17